MIERPTERAMWRDDVAGTNQRLGLQCNNQRLTNQHLNLLRTRGPR